MMLVAAWNWVGVMVPVTRASMLVLSVVSATTMAFCTVSTLVAEAMMVLSEASALDTAVRMSADTALTLAMPLPAAMAAADASMDWMAVGSDRSSVASRRRRELLPAPAALTDWARALKTARATGAKVSGCSLLASMLAPETTRFLICARSAWEV